MEIIESKTDNFIILKLEGRLDTNTAPVLEEKLMGLINNNENKIIVDFAKLDFISSSGLRVLLMIGKKLKTVNGKIGLCKLQEHVKEVFDVAGFTMLFSMFPNQEEAIKNLQ
jgi:anti-anti-sigma factor